MDLAIPQGKATTLTGDHALGWVEVSGALACDGDLSCLGIIVNPGGTLRCRRLVANIIEIDNSGSICTSTAMSTTLEAERVCARVIHMIQVVGVLGIGRPFCDLLDAGQVEYAYLHHYAGDLNPSFDYERGNRGVLRADHVEGTAVPFVIDLFAIRDELRAGRNPFVGVEPLVTVPRSDPRTAAARSPIVEELASWVAAHPGPQRSLVEALREIWLPRIVGEERADREAAARVVRKAIASPKLTAERDALLAALLG